jgi:hypothetical protein
MSLRARLLTGVLVMSAVGLLAAGGGTYLALRSFLLDRVNQQLMATRASVGRGSASIPRGHDRFDDPGPGRSAGCVRRGS